MSVTRVTTGTVVAVPRPRVVTEEPTAATQHLLRLMRTGATDRAIARELDVSLRTLNRRISRLQSMLGVQSRFQLGVLAAELEWLAVRSEETPAGV
ncbi:LuxR C-terminal-related transcriptional regulator [Lentzea sp.]|uniref:LuxR C-terminal-related transcriptional regulator n=1 Tax=Lentzea sp. TaxID=56099 RepID=UPI002CA1C174|nr:LuxR C-terminal-related transcriptional regulator [Lentzea sp.]HUQ55614.1 LuxR C-terminal-related transcriptional regulator [Lentzea sp.]